VRIANPHGVRRFSAYAEQMGALFFSSTRARPRTAGVARHEPARTGRLEAGKNKAPDLKEGQARLVWRPSPDDSAQHHTASYDVRVGLTGRVIADNAQHYINGGGMELVTFTPSGSGAKAGVRVGK